MATTVEDILDKPIIAYKVFTVSYSSALYSSRWTVWSPGEVYESKCYCIKDRNGQRPHRDGGIQKTTQPESGYEGCGFYSFESVDLASTYTGQLDMKFLQCIAEVAIGGRTYEHEYGYRSQYCTILKVIGYSMIPRGSYSYISKEIEIANKIFMEYELAWF